MVVCVRWTHFPHSSASSAEEKGHSSVIIRFLSQEVSQINRELFKTWISGSVSDEDALDAVYVAPRRLFEKVSDLLRGNAWLRCFDDREVVVVKVREDYFIAIADSPHDEDPALHFIYITSNRALTPQLVFKALEVFFRESVGDYELEIGAAELLIDEREWTAEKRSLES